MWRASSGRSRSPPGPPPRPGRAAGRPASQSRSTRSCGRERTRVGGLSERTPGRPAEQTAKRAAVEDLHDLLRELAPQVLGALVRRYGDLADGEDAVQEALFAAATQWPIEGPPDNPRGWLVAVASRRLTD